MSASSSAGATVCRMEALLSLSLFPTGHFLLSSKIGNFVQRKELTGKSLGDVYCNVRASPGCLGHHLLPGRGKVGKGKKREQIKAAASPSPWSGLGEEVGGGGKRPGLRPVEHQHAGEELLKAMVQCLVR